MVSFSEHFSIFLHSEFLLFVLPDTDFNSVKDNLDH